MDSKKPNKITEIVRLQQILKKWRKLANAPKPNATPSEGIKFLKRTLSFSDISSVSGDGPVPKGFVAVCVGEELKRYVIPTVYLGHQAFTSLLRVAEEEFGFQQEGVLRIPCQVSVFDKILKVVKEKKEESCFNEEKEMMGCCSSQAQISQSHFPQQSLCR